MWGFQLSSLHGVMVILSTPHHYVCKPIWNIANQGCSPKSWYPKPLLGLHGQLSMWLTSVSRPSGGWADTSWLRNPRINTLLDILVQSKTPGQQRHSPGMAFQGMPPTMGWGLRSAFLLVNVKILTTHAEMFCLKHLEITVFLKKIVFYLRQNRANYITHSKCILNTCYCAWRIQC